MKFRIKVREIRPAEEHWEYYDKDTNDPIAWAEDIVATFNDTLERGESARELVDVELIPESDIQVRG